MQPIKVFVSSADLNTTKLQNKGNRKTIIQPVCSNCTFKRLEMTIILDFETVIQLTDGVTWYAMKLFIPRNFDSFFGDAITHVYGPSCCFQKGPSDVSCKSPKIPLVSQINGLS